MKGNEKVSSGMIERKFAEKASVKDIFLKKKTEKKEKTLGGIYNSCRIFRYR